MIFLNQIGTEMSPQSFPFTRVHDVEIKYLPQETAGS
jgi:hypothetical protein